MKRIESQKITFKKSYNRSVKHKYFSIWDWVLRKTLGNKVETTYKNFTTTWKGFHQIYEITLGFIPDRKSPKKGRIKLEWKAFKEILHVNNVILLMKGFLIHLLGIYTYLMNTIMQ